MKVKLLVRSIVPRGDNQNNGDVAEAGETVELEDSHAEHLIAAGAAEKASGKKSDDS